VLEAARAGGVERLVHTSTSEVYGTARYRPIDEAHPLQGQSPYAASKIGADKLVESYYLSFGVPVVTVRPFNTYGPRQSQRAVIPTIIAQALVGQEIRLGSLEPRRDFNFVADTVRGFLLAGQVPRVEGAVINLGTGLPTSVGEIAKAILNLLGSSIPIVADVTRVRPPASEVMWLEANASRATDMLGWRPLVGIADGLQQTISWMRNHLARYRSAGYGV
jgi:dTDP-glucose 4,6-dehydratase